MKNIESRERLNFYGLAVLSTLPFITCFCLLKLNHYDLNYFWSAIVVGLCYLILIFRPFVSIRKTWDAPTLHTQFLILTDLVAILAISAVLIFNLSSIGYQVLAITTLTIAIVELTALTCIIIYKHKMLRGIFDGLRELIFASLLFIMLLYTEWMHKLQ